MEGERRAQVIHLPVGVDESWYYLLENVEASSLQFPDWRDNARMYGPYTSMQMAFDYMQAQVYKEERGKTQRRVEVLILRGLADLEPVLREAMQMVEMNEKALWGAEQYDKMQWRRAMGFL